MRMTESERIARLTEILRGTGANVNDAFGIWALHSKLSDEHIAMIADWADLQFLMAHSCLITEASIPHIMNFVRLTSLDIGGNRITSEAIADCKFPPHLQSLGLASISLGRSTVQVITRCTELTTLNVNDCRLSYEALSDLGGLPKLKIIEALGSNTDLATSRLLSENHPQVLFRLRDGLWQNGNCIRPAFPSEKR